MGNTWTEVAKKSSANGAISGVNTSSLRFDSYLGMDKDSQTLILLALCKSQELRLPHLEINDFGDDSPLLDMTSSCSLKVNKLCSHYHVCMGYWMVNFILYAMTARRSMEIGAFVW